MVYLCSIPPAVLADDSLKKKMREIVFEYIKDFYNRKRRHPTLWTTSPDPVSLPLGRESA
jgi:hypothetical protein